MAAGIVDIKKIKANVQKQMQTPQNKKESSHNKSFIQTGIPGFDDLFDQGIPKQSNILVTGTPGSGKTIFCLQLLAHHARKGKNCLYISFEESRTRLIEHMNDFGWNADELVKQKNFFIQRQLSSDVYYEENETEGGVQAMMSKDAGNLVMDLEPFIIGRDGFKPDFTVIDSLTAVSSTFIGKEHSYRFYAERLFRFFEEVGSTNFLISGSSPARNDSFLSGVEEFLSDGVIALYNVRRGNMRESAIEVMKMRGAKHEKKIVSMNITDGGIVVYPNQEVFGDIPTE